MNYTIFLDNYAVNRNGYLNSNGVYKKKSTEKTKDFTVYNAKASLELNAAGSLEFTMPVDHPRYNGYKYYTGDEYKIGRRRYNNAIKEINQTFPSLRDSIIDGTAECAFGNINMNKRVRYTWTVSGANNPDNNAKAAATWGYSAVKDEYVTVYPQILSFKVSGVSERIYVLMSPYICLNTMGKWIPKSPSKAYIKDILKKSVKNGSIDAQKVLKLDRSGAKVSNYRIKNMIADVCEASAIANADLQRKSCLLTYAGKYGKVQCAKDDMAKAPTKNKYWTKGLVTLKEENEYIFAGRAYAYSIDMYKRKTITCEGALNFLKDTIQPAKEYIDQTLEAMVTEWLRIHNMQVDENRQIKPGDLYQLAMYEGYRVTDYETTWECLQKFILDTNDGVFNIRVEGIAGSNKVELYLDYYTQYMTVLRRKYNQIVKLINDQPIQFKGNLLDIAESFSLDGIYTRVLPLGKTFVDTKEEEEEGGGDDPGSDTQEPTDTSSLNRNAVGTGVAIACGTWIRSGPGDAHEPIGGYPWINGGDRVEVCDIAYNESGEAWYYIRVVGAYYGFVKSSEFDAQVSMSQLPHYRR